MTRFDSFIFGENKCSIEFILGHDSDIFLIFLIF